MTDLWTEASHDHEAEHSSGLLAVARANAAPVWPTLAGAADERDYANRKAIVAERLFEAAGKDQPTFEALVASLDADFAVLAEDRRREAALRQRLEAIASQKTATRYCKTHEVFIGEGNEANHDEACSIEERKTEASKLAAGADNFGDKKAEPFGGKSEGKDPDDETVKADLTKKDASLPAPGSGGLAIAVRKLAEDAATTHSADTPEGGDHIGPKNECPICTTPGGKADPQHEIGDFYTQGSRHPFVREADMQKGAPFAGYSDFDACVAANGDKDDPEAYCGKIKHEVEGRRKVALTDADCSGSGQWVDGNYGGPKGGIGGNPAENRAICPACGQTTEVTPGDGGGFLYVHLLEGKKPEDRAAGPHGVEDFRLRGSRRTAGIHLTNVAFEGQIGNNVARGTDSAGNVVRFRLSPQDVEDLKHVLLSDLSVNFSGVEIDEADIITDTVASKTAADAVPEGCLGCIVMGGTPIVIKAGCPVHDTDADRTAAKTAQQQQVCNSCGNEFGTNNNGAERCPKCKSSDLKRKYASKPCKGIVITTDKVVTERDIYGLADMQGVVAGLVEAVDLKDGSTMWVNDSFAYTNAPFNSIASDVAGLGGRPDLMMRGIKGNVVITGGPDANGDTSDIPETAKRWVNRVAREASLKATAEGHHHEEHCPKCSAVVGVDPNNESGVKCSSCDWIGTWGQTIRNPKKDASRRTAGDNPFPPKKDAPAGPPDQNSDQPAENSASSFDPTQMQPGQQVTVNYTLTNGGGAGSTAVTFESNQNGVFYFTYEKGRFGVTQQGGKWVDSQGTEFVFDDAGAEKPEEAKPDEGGDAGGNPFAKGSAKTAAPGDLADTTCVYCGNGGSDSTTSIGGPCHSSCAQSAEIKRSNTPGGVLGDPDPEGPGYHSGHHDPWTD